MMKAMEQVETFLKSLDLGKYVPLCELNGYDHLGCILSHDDDELDMLSVTSSEAVKKKKQSQYRCVKCSPNADSTS